MNFKSQKVAAKMSTPMTYVQYIGNQAFDDFTDAVFISNPGCQKANIGSTGFKVWTTYIFGTWPGCASYKYEDTYEFYQDGQMYHYVNILGPGFCNYTQQYYMVFMRHDYDVAVITNYLDTWESSGWVNRLSESNYYYQSPYLGSPLYDWRTYSTGKQVTEAPAFAASSPDHYILRYTLGQEDAGQDFQIPPLGSWVNGQSISPADIVNGFVPYAIPNPTKCQPSYPCKNGNYAPLSGY